MNFKEFFEVDSFMDVLTIIAFIMTIIMFIPWLQENKRITAKIFSIYNLSFLFLIIAAYFLFNGKLGYSCLSYFIWWLISVYEFFKVKIDDISKLKISIFNFTIKTCIIFMVAQLFMIDLVIEKTAAS